MSQKIVCMTGIILATVVASANTAAWWHFDEEAPGTTATSGVVTESVSGATATSYTITSNKVEQINSYRPVFGRAFPGLAVYDPVAGTTNANRSAMKFVTARGGATPNTNAGRAYYGGAFKIDGGNSLYANCTGSVTIEAFVCTTGGVYNTFAPIIGCLASAAWTGEKWAIYMENGGTLAVRFNGNVWYSGNSLQGTATINDGRWHHIALTWDGSTLKVYVDYVLDKKPDKSGREYSKTGTIDYAGTATWMGGYGTYDANNGGRKFPGLVDEVRISDVALTPGQFLRLVPSEDEETVMRLRFDAEASGELSDKEVVGGTFDLQAVYYLVPGADASTYDTANKVGAAIADGIYSDGVTNASSFFQVTNSAGKANYIRAENVTNHLFPEGAPDPTNLNYTVEAFFKANASVQTRRTIFKLGSDYLPAQVITGDANHLHQLSFCSTYGSGKTWKEFISPVDKPYDDGEWHHVAVVSDAASNVIRFYYDYALVAATNAYVPVKKTYPICVAGRKDSNNTDQFFEGWIDDVRVMKRALRPEEFLTTHAVGSASPRSLLLARFEQNYDFVCEAEAALSVTGTGSARPNGNVPTFEKVSPGALLLDGTNGTERVANDYSVHLNKSRVVFPISRLYENEAYTVEFWAKFTGFDGGRAPNYSASGQHAGILRFVQGNTTTLDWYLYRPGDQLMTMQMAVRNADGTIPSSNYLTWSLPNIVADSKWHHYALLFKPTDGNSKTAIELYYDYQPCGTKTINSLLHFNPGGHRLMVGESSTDSMPNILGYVNALRLSRGTLAPEMFLGRVSRGTTIIFR